MDVTEETQADLFRNWKTWRRENPLVQASPGTHEGTGGNRSAAIH